MPALVALALGFGLFGGGTIGLVPDGDPVSPAMEGEPPPSEDREDGPSSPGPIELAGAVIAAAALTAARRRRVAAPGTGLGLADPVFVFVPGHGQPPAAEAFSDLIDLMDLDDDQTRFFDYRWAGGGEDHLLASRAVPIDTAAATLNAFLAGMDMEDRSTYLVGFSKGGATVAELVADWDDGMWGPSGSVAGAVLLDPPIASGVHGWLQSAGRVSLPVPDDGGYDPVACDFLVFGCEDRRDHLGRNSGVEVVVIRNPRAALTSFSDLPEGLRVYDAPDDGPGPLRQLLRNPLAVPGRIAEAHESVLRDPAVASCVVAEATGVGECGLRARSATPPLPGISRRAVRAPAAQRVL